VILVYNEYMGILDLIFEFIGMLISIVLLPVRILLGLLGLDPFDDK
jgi:hypothetical protein